MIIICGQAGFSSLQQRKSLSLFSIAANGGCEQLVGVVDVTLFLRLCCLLLSPEFCLVVGDLN